MCLNFNHIFSDRKIQLQVTWNNFLPSEESAKWQMPSKAAIKMTNPIQKPCLAVALDPKTVNLNSSVATEECWHFGMPIFQRSSVSAQVSWGMEKGKWSCQTGVFWSRFPAHYLTSTWVLSSQRLETDMVMPAPAVWGRDLEPCPGSLLQAAPWAVWPRSDFNLGSANLKITWS